MSGATSFAQLVAAHMDGMHPTSVVESMLGPDRTDDFTSDDVRAREFTRIASQAASAFPYIGPDWIGTIAQAVRQADAQGMQELVRMSTQNRDQYAGTARIDSDGSFALWDAILKGLLAVPTTQLPPPAPPLNTAPLP